MISRLRGAASKTAGSAGYRQVLRWAALPVTDRRWAAPLSAVALGFGLFAGVAIGPGATGTFATGAAQIIEIPGLSGDADSEEGDGSGAGSSASSNTVDVGGGKGSAPVAQPVLPAFAPIASSEGEDETSAVTPPSSQGLPSSGKESPPEGETLAGIVLHVNPAAASYAIAEAEGTLDAIHAAKLPQPGERVSVPVRLLANGTFAEAGARTKSGLQTRATLSGVVTYVDSTATAPAYTVSKRGVSVLVRVHPDPTGAAPTLPALGAFASVAVKIEKLPSASASEAPAPATPVSEPVPPVTPTEPSSPLPTEAAPAVPAPAAEPIPTPAQPGCAPDPALPSPLAIQAGAILWQRQIKAQGAPFAYSDFAGIVEAVCPDSPQLLLSADDIRESGHDLAFAVPASIDTAKLEVGQSILATATITTDGALSLTGLASDERAKGAEDAKAIQGDLVAKRPSARSRPPR